MLNWYPIHLIRTVIIFSFWIFLLLYIYFPSFIIATSGVASKLIRARGDVGPKTDRDVPPVKI